jgi:hypothetical protein
MDRPLHIKYQSLSSFKSGLHPFRVERTAGVHKPRRLASFPYRKSVVLSLVNYSTMTMSPPLRPKTSGEYISSALAGGTTNVPGVVARAT